MGRDGDHPQGFGDHALGAGRGGNIGLASLVKSLADNKQLLGMRYAEWCIAAPSLEADIAAAAMGLDDIGHSRVLYGCVHELPDRAEADEGIYTNVPYLDDPWTDWSQFVAANAVLDTAFTLMIEAMVGGNVEVLRSRLRKMLQEERYHFLHGRSWLKETHIASSVHQAWQQSIEWFGPEGSDIEVLHNQGTLSLGRQDLTRRLEERLEMPTPTMAIEWGYWDSIRRRTSPGGIDQRTLDMLRGLAEKRYMPASGQRAQA